MTDIFQQDEECYKRVNFGNICRQLLSEPRIPIRNPAKGKFRLLTVTDISAAFTLLLPNIFSSVRRSWGSISLIYIIEEWITTSTALPGVLPMYHRFSRISL